jgi:hypothetical protein
MNAKVNCTLMERRIEGKGLGLDSRKESGMNWEGLSITCRDEFVLKWVQSLCD